jgi:putative intracellular protease/amidase
MATIVTLLTEGFADWEIAMLNGVARGFYGIETRFATPGGEPVRSSGGMRVTPDLALADADPQALDVLVICGGSIWQSPDAPDIGPAVAAVRAAGKVVAGICDGTVALARTGLLDTVEHTSNAADHLEPTGYPGKPHYRDVPHAVAAEGVITAPATAPVTFMASVLRAIGVDDANLDYYLALLAAEHHRAA